MCHRVRANLCTRTHRENYPHLIPAPPRPHTHFSYTLPKRETEPGVMSKQSFQWLPGALGMKPKPLTRPTGLVPRSPARRPDLLVLCCCPLAHPGAAALAAPPSFACHRVPGPPTPTPHKQLILILRPSFTYRPQEAFSTHEVIQQICIGNLQLAGRSGS